MVRQEERKFVVLYKVYVGTAGATSQCFSSMANLSRVARAAASQQLPSHRATMASGRNDNAGICQMLKEAADCHDAGARQRNGYKLVVKPRCVLQRRANASRTHATLARVAMSKRAVPRAREQPPTLPPSRPRTRAPSSVGT